MSESEKANLSHIDALIVLAEMHTKNKKLEAENKKLRECLLKVEMEIRLSNHTTGLSLIMKTLWGTGNELETK